MFTVVSIINRVQAALLHDNTENAKIYSLFALGHSAGHVTFEGVTLIFYPVSTHQFLFQITFLVNVTIEKFVSICFMHFKREVEKYVTIYFLQVTCK